MAAPTWSVGQVLTASDVNGWFVPSVRIKASNTGRPTQTVVTADPDLVLPVLANASYELIATLVYDGGPQGGSDFQWQWTLPSGATLVSSPTYKDTTGSPISGTLQPAGSSLTAGTFGAGNQRALTSQGIVTVGATAGNLTLLWAQGSSHSTPTILHTGSTAKLVRIA